MHFITGMYSLQLYITICHERDGVSDTPEHSNHIYLPSSSLIRGEPVRISSMLLFVAYAFYYRNVFSIIIYHHMPRERRCLRHSGAQQSHLPAEFLSNRRHRHRGMAASSPLHRDASASRQPSTHSLHCFTACNAALPSHKHEGLVGPLR